MHELSPLPPANVCAVTVLCIMILVLICSGMHKQESNESSNQDKRRAVEVWLLKYYDSMSDESYHDGYGDYYLCAHHYDDKHAKRQRIVGEEYDRLGCIVRAPTKAQRAWFDDFSAANPRVKLRR